MLENWYDQDPNVLARMMEEFLNHPGFEILSDILDKRIDALHGYQYTYSRPNELSALSTGEALIALTAAINELRYAKEVMSNLFAQTTTYIADMKEAQNG